MKDVVAILASDIHLQQKAPVARCEEPSWFEAMARPLGELKALQKEWDCPILYAGDIFDSWYSTPELINFACRHLPKGYAVPGQHDLPNHSMEEIYRSAYWTLVEAGVLKPLDSHLGLQMFDVRGTTLAVHGFPWGADIVFKAGGGGWPTDPAPVEADLHVAVIHKYIWGKDTGYPGAPKANTVKAYKGQLEGFDVAAFGDNHKGFIRTTKDGPTICNCGAMMRRKTDEREYRPGCGLLHADGTVTRHHYDTSQDRFIELTEAEEQVEKVLDMTAFVDDLRALGVDDALDFRDAMERFLDQNEPEQRVRELVLAAMEEV